MADTEQEVFKYAVKSEGFNMWLDGKHVHPKVGVLVLTKKQHEELQGLIEKGNRPDITIELTYLDEKAAEETAKAFIANMKPAAVQGAAHSQANAERTGSEVLKELVPKEPPGMTLKDRLAARAANVLANAVEKGVTHGEDTTLKDVVKS